MVRANKDGQIRIMIPMVTTRDEILYIKGLLEEICQSEQIPMPKLGVMIETPASISLIPYMKGLVDFLSVGSNDLLQFLTAADRNLFSLKHIYNPLHPSLIDSLETIRTNYRDLTGKSRLDLSICGEIASNPVMIPLLLALGYRKLSIAPPQALAVKTMISSLKLDFCRKLLKEVKKYPTIYEREEIIKARLGEIKG